MNAETVTAEYVDGIADARKEWRTMTPAERIELAPRMLANCKETMTRFSAGPVKDHLRGARDFWANQVAKAA